MGATKIEWTDYTWNPWRGCQKVSPGCEHCYASAQSKRSPDVLGIWGPPGTGRRVVAAEDYWRLPHQWDREAQKAGERRRVFCGSLMDLAEQWNHPVYRDGRQLLVADEEPNRWLPRPNGGERLTPTEKENLHTGVYRQLWLTDVRRRMFDVMRATKHLDWLLLTKRPENVPAILAEITGFVDWFDGQPQYWIGTSVEDQATADKRIPALLKIPAAIRFLSVEPLIGPVDLTKWLPFRRADWQCQKCGAFEHTYGKCLFCGAAAEYKSGSHAANKRTKYGWINRQPLDWVILGGESGPHARPCNIEWIRSIVRQCKAAGVPCFVKQAGSCIVDDYYGDDDQWRETLLSLPHTIARCDHGLYTEVDPAIDGQPPPGSVIFGRLTHPKGGDVSEWPEDLRVREFPEA